MKRNISLAALVFAALLFPAAVGAQEQAATSSPIDPQLRADILRLIQLTRAVERAEEGARASAESLRPRLLAALPPSRNREKIVADYVEKVASIPQTPDFVDGLVAIYAKYFSDEDLKALTQFYDTPAGRHFNEHAGDVAMDTMKLGREVVALKLPATLAAVCADYPELQDQSRICSSSPGAKGQVAADPR
jgi:hypothetical protein